MDLLGGVALLLPLAAALTQSQYCDPQLCNIFNGTDFVVLPHIGCHNNASFGDSCHNAMLVPMTKRRRNLVLDLHNAARSKIALGQVDGYEPAASMPELQWDDELQFLAELNVRTCEFRHDQCRNTERFRFAGQNIGVMRQGAPMHSNSKRIRFVIGKWFEEYRDANASFVEAFQLHPEGKQIGHFTTMLSDQVQRVGCAVARFTNQQQTTWSFLMTCNYDYTSVFEQPVYNSGQAASECASSSRKSRFAGLCAWDLE